MSCKMGKCVTHFFIFEETNIKLSTFYKKKLASRNAFAIAAGNRSGTGAKPFT